MWFLLLGLTACGDLSFPLDLDPSPCSSDPCGPKTEDLTVLGAGDGTGTVVSDPGIVNCRILLDGWSGACASSFLTGTLVTLTATAGEVSVFVGWSGACSGTNPKCMVLVDQDKTVTATFTRPKGLAAYFPLKVGMSWGYQNENEVEGTVGIRQAITSGDTIRGKPRKA
jgi:uncharacterized repeat protein (TIGR02543 family)